MLDSETSCNDVQRFYHFTSSNPPKILQTLCPLHQPSTWPHQPMPGAADSKILLSDWTTLCIIHEVLIIEFNSNIKVPLLNFDTYGFYAVLVQLSIAIPTKLQQSQLIFQTISPVLWALGAILLMLQLASKGAITRQSKKRDFNPNNLGSRWKPPGKRNVERWSTHPICPDTVTAVGSSMTTLVWKLRKPWSLLSYLIILTQPKGQRRERCFDTWGGTMLRHLFFLSLVCVPPDCWRFKCQHLSYLKRLILLDSKLEHCWALLALRRWSLMLMILESSLSDLKKAKVQDSPNVDGGLRHEKYWTVTFFGIRVLSRFSLFQHSTNSLLKDIQGIYHST